MKKVLLQSILGLFLTALLISSCGKEAAQETPQSDVATVQVFETADDLVAAIKPNFKEIAPEVLKSKIAAGSNFFLIDIRDKEEFDAGNIEGAINVSRGVLEFRLTKIIPEIKKNDEIILYCKQGDRTVLALESLARIGYTNIWGLTGGWDTWDSGNDKEAAPVKKAEGQKEGEGC